MHASLMMGEGRGDGWVVGWVNGANGYNAN